MIRQGKRYPTELELELLKILWKHGPGTVSQVREVLTRQGRKMAYTSVMTMLTIMTQKGYLIRAKQGKSFTYTPIISERLTLRSMLEEWVVRVFNGSRAAVMTNLLEDTEINADELKQLRKLINRKIQGETK
jgi:BlaI family transcriptional regulator, penicillinase repressor